jgi:DNA-binding protein Fis
VKPTTTPIPPPITWPHLRKILSRPIAYHRIFATIGGGAKAGLFLSQGFYWTNIQDEHAPEADGWFWKTQADWQIETGLTRDEQETARARLIKRRLMREELRGLPAKLYFQFNKEAILFAVWASINGDTAEMSQTSLRESTKQGRAKTSNKIARKPQALIRAQTTAETSSQTTAGAPRRVDDDDEASLSEQLRATGLNLNDCKNFAANHADSARRHLEYLPFETIKRTPGAYLKRAIPEDWPPPSRYLAAQQAAASQAQRADEAKATAAERKRQEEQRAREQAENDQLDAHFKSLTAQDRKEIDDMAARSLGAALNATQNKAGAMAAARRNILRKELQMPVEEADDE